MKIRRFPERGARGRALAFVIGLALLLAMATGLALAQEPEPQIETEASGPTDLEAIAAGAIPIQGRLTDQNGAPLNGTFSVTFRLYESSSGGTALCSDNNNVTVQNGLFSSYVDGCYDFVTGQRLYLGVQVGSDPEMTPRQAIYAVPYALSLVPGAVISYTTDGVLTVRSTGSGDSDALLAYAANDGEAVTASSQAGVAIASFSTGYLAFQGYGQGSGNNPAIFGCAAPNSSICDPYRDDNAAGVMGVSSHGDGVWGYATNSTYRGLYGHNSAGGIAIAGYNSSNSHNLPTLYLVQADAAGDYVAGAGTYGGTRTWRVDRTGKGFFNGGTQTGGADFAEQIAVEGEEADYQVGDVLVISAEADRTVTRATRPFDTAVVGVYSAQPGFLGGAPDTDDPLAGIPVAVMGIVPCRVSAENGPIARGDLLVTAATPGHAMRAGENPPVGAVLGKAFGALEAGTGMIPVLVTLR
jgi:hypothetical protein